MAGLTRSATLGAWLLGALLGCGEPAAPPPPAPPEAISASEECHLCGMVVRRFAGPKGEAFLRGHRRALKFCSTRDLFAWLLQPEHRDNAGAVYVHDLGATGWDAPADEAFTDARSAWYVWGHPLSGAMGHTLASFRRRADAEAFARAHGGQIYPFAGVTLELIAARE